MNSKNLIKKKSREICTNKSKDIFNNLKSNYILYKIFYHMNKKKILEIIKYNIKIQKRLNISIKHYKEISGFQSLIEIDIIPAKNTYGEFISFFAYRNYYFHIYFNDDYKEIEDKYSISKEDNVTRIKIIIDYNVESLKNLFFGCHCIESIVFRKFRQTNIKYNLVFFYL